MGARKFVIIQEDIFLGESQIYANRNLKQRQKSSLLSVWQVADIKINGKRTCAVVRLIDIKNELSLKLNT